MRGERSEIFKMRIKYVISLQLLLLFGAATAQINMNKVDYENFEPDDHCDAYCFNILKPLMENMAETRIKLKDYENIIKSKGELIVELEKQLTLLKTNEALCNEKLQQRDDQIKVLEQRTCSDNNNEDQTKATPVSDFQVDNLNSASALQLIQELPQNCLEYGNSTEINEIAVPNVGRVQVLCDYDGWTVVQRRFDGSEDFYRNWSDYRNGFGKLQGEFFIGLEALHQMTASQRYELYIELADFHDHIRYARYDNFVIGGNDEDYSLKSLGSYTGDAGDALRYNLGEKFTTFDWDNDDWNGGNCAKYYASGGWYAWYANSNLFGKYFESQVESVKSIWWYNWKGYKALSSVKMMIRPKD